MHERAAGHGSDRDGLPDDLQHLDERERAQAIAHRELFVEQEHGLRQN